MIITDQTNYSFELSETPNKIVSVVPSQTELLSNLGLNKEVIGITKFCIHPHDWFRTKTRIGGTKKLNIEKIKELQPDIIFANKEENEKSDIDELKKYFPVWISDIKDLGGALKMIRSISEITGKEIEGKKIIQTISEKFKLLPTLPLKTCVYLIWNDPIMTVGGDTFISDMLNHAGYKNLFSGESRYPEITIEMLQKLNPEILFLSSEPFPFKETHIEHYQKLLPQTKVLKIDGEMFSWYGSRLMLSPEYFLELVKSTK